MSNPSQSGRSSLNSTTSNMCFLFDVLSPDLPTLVTTILISATASSGAHCFLCAAAFKTIDVVAHAKEKIEKNM